MASPYFFSSQNVSYAKNFAQNASFRYYQRQVPGTLTSWQDDQYGPDRWYVLTSGGAVNVNVARVTESITASPGTYVGQFRQADGTARQFGAAQILENAHVQSLRGVPCTFSFWARTDGTEITTLRASVVEWTSTADSVTSDIVSSWSGTPTLIANATYLNTPADLTLSATWAQFTINVTPSSSMNNLVLFIWTPNTEAQNDDFYIAQTQLVIGSSALPWPAIEKSPADDLIECQRFYEKSYELAIAPGTNVGDDSAGAWVLRVSVVVTTTNAQRSAVQFNVCKRSSPTMVGYSTGGASAKMRDRTNAADVVPAFIQGSHGTQIECSASSTTTLQFFEGHWTAAAEL